jgi:hypothetical protein
MPKRSPSKIFGKMGFELPREIAIAVHARPECKQTPSHGE